MLGDIAGGLVGGIQAGLQANNALNLNAYRQRQADHQDFALYSHAVDLATKNPDAFPAVQSMLAQRGINLPPEIAQRADDARAASGALGTAMLSGDPTDLIKLSKTNQMVGPMLLGHPVGAHFATMMQNMDQARQAVAAVGDEAKTR